MSLPIGYRMEWGGEFENSANANESLAKQLPLSLLVMVLISIFSESEVSVVVFSLHEMRNKLSSKAMKSERIAMVFYKNTASGIALIIFVFLSYGCTQRIY